MQVYDGAAGDFRRSQHTASGRKPTAVLCQGNVDVLRLEVPELPTARVPIISVPINVSLVDVFMQFVDSKANSVSYKN
jgi:hypothetical protein